MKERGILFTPENYAMCASGAKTQTRRIIKAKKKRELDPLGIYDHVPGDLLKCPFGTVGDRLYVKESFTYWECGEECKPKKGERFEELSCEKQARIIEQSSRPGCDYLVYKRDGAKRSLAEWPYPHPIYEHCIGKFDKTVSPIFMPKWAARLWLDLTDVRVERLHEITTEDIQAEGVDCNCLDGGFDSVLAFGNWIALWESINGKGSWDLNPFVWVLGFRRIT
jgi:hypothetical protein